MARSPMACVKIRAAADNPGWSGASDRRRRRRAHAGPAWAVGARGRHRGRSPRVDRRADRLRPGGCPAPGTGHRGRARDVVPLRAGPQHGDRGPQVKLDALAARLPGSVVHGDSGVDVGEVTYDSRVRAGPGTLFVAVKGMTTDGNQFVDAARRKGAGAVASESPPQPGGPWIQVPDARQALAAFSAAVLGDPAASLELVGVTGTNGKTTTSYLIDAAVRAAGHTAGLLGTVQYRIGDRLSEAVRTTPEASDLQQLFKEMVVASCTHAVLESLVAFARARPRVRLRVPRRGVHEPDPRPPRLPWRHGPVLRSQASAVRHVPPPRRARLPERRGRSHPGARRRLAGAGVDVRRRSPRRLRGRRHRAEPRGDALPAAVAARHLRRADPAPRALQRPEPARRLCRLDGPGARPEGRPRGADLDRGSARPAGARASRRPALHRRRRLRAHRRRAQEGAGDRPPAEPESPDHRFRLWRRPGQVQAPAHGGRRHPSLRHRNRDVRQPPLRTPRGYPRRDTEGDERRPRGRASRHRRPPRRHRPRIGDGPPRRPRSCASSSSPPTGC